MTIMNIIVKKSVMNKKKINKLRMRIVGEIKFLLAKSNEFQ